MNNTDRRLDPNDTMPMRYFHTRQVELDAEPLYAMEDDTPLWALLIDWFDRHWLLTAVVVFVVAVLASSIWPGRWFTLRS